MFRARAPSCGWPRGKLTQENDDAGQDGDERPSAQAGVQDVGLGVAGEQCPVHVAPTDLDAECVGAAHGRDSTIADHDGQEVEILLLPTEPPAPGVHPSGVIWGTGETRRVLRMEPSVLPSSHSGLARRRAEGARLITKVNDQHLPTCSFL